MNKLRETFTTFRAHLGMFVRNEDFSHAVALLVGYDVALEGGALVGFKEWLVLRSRRGKNLAWGPLVLRLAFPDSVDPDAELQNPERNAHALRLLFHLLEEYTDERAGPSGLSSIFSRYEAMGAERPRRRRTPLR